MKCGTCRWWSDEEGGECRESPPDIHGKWPPTAFHDWCGHWQGHVLEELKSDDNTVSGGETVE